MAVDGVGLARLIDLANSPCSAGRVGQMPPAGKVGPRRTLTVGMATYDDFDGTYFTIMGLRLYHPEVADRISILIVDNNPCGKAAWALKRLEKTIPGVRYVPVTDVQSTAIKTRVFEEANSEWVLCVDCHIQLVPGALAKLLEFIDAHPDCTDLLQGPLLDDSLQQVSTHWEPRWHEGMLGVWATNPRGIDPGAPPFDIPMQGMGVFGCRKDAWLGFNPRFRGHGGEEGYVHHKFRAAGRRTLCLPFLRWTHRFERPNGVPYPITYDDRLRNYLIGWDELGLAIEPVLDHFRHIAGPELVEQVVARWQAEKASPFTAFGAIVCPSSDCLPQRWAKMGSRFEQLGIAGCIRRIPAADTPDNPEIGRALSHRTALDLAHREDLESVLVIEDDAVFLQGATWVLRRSMRELQGQTWGLFCLSAGPEAGHHPLVEGCAYLAASEVITPYALAYHRRVYDRLLAELPEDETRMRAWIKDHQSITTYLATTVTTGVFCTTPLVTAPEAQLPWVEADLRDQFITDPPAHVTAASPPPLATAQPPNSQRQRPQRWVTEGIYPHLPDRAS
jgi:Glycosyl transferase family 2